MTDLTFTSIDVGQPGRVHDSGVLRKSALWYEDGEPLGDVIASSNFHLLGDKGYPVKEYILSPYREDGIFN